MSERTRNRGELEAQIMRILWSAHGPLDGSQILAGFTEGQVPAYTTVLTTLDRLEKKKLVKRSGTNARRLLFETVSTEDEQISASMHSALQSVADREATLLRFAGNLSNDDLTLLRRAIGNPKS